LSAEIHFGRYLGFFQIVTLISLVHPEMLVQVGFLEVAGLARHHDRA
jgi:hypothetical protein